MDVDELVEKYIFMSDFHNVGLGLLHLGPERVEVATVEGADTRHRT